MKFARNLSGIALLGLVNLIAPMPKSTYCTLRTEFLHGKYRAAVGWCIWVIRCKFLKGYLLTSVNPAAICRDFATAEYILRQMQSLPVTPQDALIVEIACTLWQGRFPLDEGTFREHSKFRTDLKAFITLRSLKFESVANKIPIRLRSEIESLPASDIAIIKDVAKSVKKAVFEAVDLGNTELPKAVYQEFFDSLSDLIQTLKVNNVEAFLCGETLRLAIVSGILFEENPHVDLGVFAPLANLVDPSLPMGWTLCDVNSENDVVLYKHTNGMIARFWIHRSVDEVFIRSNKFLTWSYKPFDLCIISLSAQSFLRPDNTYVSEEFGKLTVLDKVFSRTGLEAYNVSLKSNVPGSFVFLAQEFAAALLASDRGQVRMITDLLREAYGVPYDHYMPVTDASIRAVSINSERTLRVDDAEYKKGRGIINTAIQARLNVFSAKPSSTNGDDFWIALKAVKRALVKNKIPFFLIGGTLLGAVREGGFISSDYDIDIGVFQKENEEFTLCGIFARNPSFTVKGCVSSHLVKIVHKSGVEVDIFLHDKIKGRLRHKGRVHEWFNDDFSIGEFDLLGETFGVPQDYEKWLSENYGHWRSPILFYNVSYDTPNRIFVKDRCDAIYHLSWQIEKSLKHKDKSNFDLACQALRTDFKIDVNAMLEALT